MIEQALRLDARQLRRAGNHLLNVLDPEGAEAAEARRLHDEEQAAAARTRLSLYDDRDGSTQITGTIPTRHAHLFRKALDAYANPDRPDPIARTVTAIDPDTGQATEVTRHAAAVLGEAFCQLLSHLDVAKMPSNGGMTASVVVTIPFETLIGGLRPGIFETGATLSPGQARRMACEAGIIPAVLGNRGTCSTSVARPDSSPSPAPGHVHPAGSPLCRGRVCPTHCLGRGPPPRRLDPGRADEPRPRSDDLRPTPHAGPPSRLPGRGAALRRSGSPEDPDPAPAALTASRP